MSMANLIVECDDGGVRGRLGKPTPDVVLTPAERETLVCWARRPKSAQALALRCRIVLACAQGRTNGEIAAELSLNRTTVGKWRRRFAELRLDGLVDEPRCRPPPYLPLLRCLVSDSSLDQPPAILYFSILVTAASWLGASSACAGAFGSPRFPFGGKARTILVTEIGKGLLLGANRAADERCARVMDDRAGAMCRQ